MEKKFAEIIVKSKKQGAPVEAINAELKAAGATFHLNPDGSAAGWSEAEMAEGFIPAETEPESLRKELDLSRREDLAGTVQRQKIVGAVYDVTYDELGYAVKAVRVRHD